ncbi:MAG: type IV toxin-antitoxin system AbiEi family antitoxin domain-containing protein [Candidatus Aminicenantaceae bacterium]
MTLSEALRKIKAIGQPVLRTADVMTALDIKKSHASKILERLAQHGHLIRLKRGLWAVPENLEPLSLAQHLTAPLPSYVSLQSALYYHDMISQIPEVIYCVSLARTRIYKTPVAAISVHHIPASFFFGYKARDEQHVMMALPEKALLDFLYLSPSRSRLFTALPEIEFPPQFRIKTAHTMIQKIADPRRRTLVRKHFEQLLDQRG